MDIVLSQWLHHVYGMRFYRISGTVIVYKLLSQNEKRIYLPCTVFFFAFNQIFKCIIIIIIIIIIRFSPVVGCSTV